MKVSYKVVGAAGWRVMFDLSATQAPPVVGVVLLEDPFHFKFSSVVDEKPLYGSQAQFRSPKGNIVTSFPLKFLVAYNSTAAALASVRAYNALVNVKIHLKWEDGPEFQYYPNAVARDYEPVGDMTSVIHNFPEFRSDNVTTTTPTT